MGLIYSQNNVVNIHNNLNDPNQPNQPQIENNNQFPSIPSMSNNQITNNDEKINIVTESTNKKLFVHKIIENIFKINLSPNDEPGELYLELYHAQLLSNEKEEIFELDEVDNVILEIINGTERVIK